MSDHQHVTDETQISSRTTIRCYSNRPQESVVRQNLRLLLHLYWWSEAFAVDVEEDMAGSAVVRTEFSLHEGSILAIFHPQDLSVLSSPP